MYKYKPKLWESQSEKIWLGSIVHNWINWLLVIELNYPTNRWYNFILWIYKRKKELNFGIELRFTDVLRYV